MDPALLKQRNDFKAHAMKMPTVEHKRRPPDDTSNRSAKKMRPARPKPAPTSGPFDYKTARGSSQFKFSILSKIVRYMKDRHQKGDTHPLNIDEVLEETNQTDLGARHKHWLTTEALNNNPKIQVIEGELYKFKPKYNIRDRKGLLRLLDKHDRQGLGGILMDDVEESMPRFQKALKILGDQVVQIQRPIDKKVVLFYNDKNSLFEVDEEMQKLWRGVAVEGTDEAKIEEYLGKQGIATMQDIQRTAPVPKRKKGGKKKPRAFKTHNEHVDGVLQDYSDVKK